jgi:hypothetical protein
LIKWLYWNSSVSLSEFDDYQHEVMELLGKQDKANRAMLRSIRELTETKNAQNALNKVFLNKLGITGDPANPDDMDLGDVSFG